MESCNWSACSGPACPAGPAGPAAPAAPRPLASRRRHSTRLPRRRGGPPLPSRRRSARPSPGGGMTSSPRRCG
eukprot:15077852-Heterocapsa_arctica.AAC.1